MREMYHHELGMPRIDWPEGFANDLFATDHAFEEAGNDRYGSFSLPNKVAMNGVDVAFGWENDDGITVRSGKTSTCTLEDGELFKFGGRVPYCNKTDINVVVILEPSGSDKSMIVTAWRNRKDDYPGPTGTDFVKPVDPIWKHSGEFL